MLDHVGFPKNKAKFTGKLELFLTKLRAFYFQPPTFIQKETPAQMLSCEFCKISKNTFFIEQLDVAASLTSTLLKIDSEFSQIFIEKDQNMNLQKASVLFD